MWLMVLSEVSWGRLVSWVMVEFVCVMKVINGFKSRLW